MALNKISKVMLEDNVATKIDKIDGLETSLADIPKLLYDIDSTTYKNGDSIFIDKIRSKQIYLHANLYKKIKTGQTVQLCAMGDSITYGQDEVSGDKRAADTTLCPDGSAHTFTRAGVTYPEALQTNLQAVYGADKVTVINRGYSGDWVKKGIERWKTKHSSDATIIMYGTNDSNPSATWVPVDMRGNLENYLKYMEQLVIREILWDKAVILVSPIKKKTASDLNLDSFANALKLLGEKYNVPVIDGELFLANYPYTVYSDSTHLNTNGYKVIASKMAAFIIGSGANSPVKVASGKKLLTRPSLDNVVYIGGANFGTGSGAYTPEETTSGQNIIANIPNSGDAIIYSIYTEEEDLIVLPWYWSGAKNLKITLDFNTVIPQNSIDGSVYGATDTSPKEITYNSSVWDINSPDIDTMIKPINDSSQANLLRIKEAGWHTIMITNPASSNLIVFNGISFIGYEEYQNIRLRRSYNYEGFLKVNIPATYSGSPPAVNSSTFTLSDLTKVFGNAYSSSTYYTNPTLKITVSNYGLSGSATLQSILEYGLVISTGSATNGGVYQWLISRKDVATTPSERTITSITFDSTTSTFTITWAGATSCYSNFVITVM